MSGGIRWDETVCEEGRKLHRVKIKPCIQYFGAMKPGRVI